VGKFSPEAFRTACGASGPLSLLVEQGKGPETGFCFLRQPFALVGRNTVSDVVLNDKRVSRRHAYLQILGGALFCVDLNSHTGTHWQDGSRLAGWLLPMESIRLGGYALRLLAESSAENPFQALNPMAARCLEKPSVTLQFLSGRKSQPELSVDRMLVLMGTSSCCKVRLHDPSVAPVHASLVSTPEGAWVVDLLSLTGLKINGQKARLARLEDGDELQIGTFTMRVRCQRAAGFAMQPTPTGFERGVAKNGSVRNDQITDLAVGVIGKEITPATAPERPQSLQNPVDNSARAMLESVFFPMVQQFSAMQSQMFDQFQQAMVLMFQMFGTLQKEQADVVRSEMNRIQELTREIQALHADLKAPALSNAGATVAKPRAFGEKPSSNGTPPMSVAACDGQLRGSPRNAGFAEQQVSIPARQSGNPVEKLPPKSTDQAGTEVHAWLCERMAELQEDRRSRMQKIVDFLSGK
jgi:pSer/pThr/pTyr-binding forkhead associated (FHA) protein